MIKEEEEYIPVAKLDDFTGKIKVEVKGVDVLVININGAIFAISDRCGHMGVSLFYGEMDGYTIECPLHGIQYDVRTGKPVVLESKKLKLKFLKEDLDALFKGLGLPQVKIRPLTVFQTKVDDGVIKVKLPECIL